MPLIHKAKLKKPQIASQVSTVSPQFIEIHGNATNNHPPSSISSSISAIPRLTTRGLATESSPLQFSFSLLGTKCTITLALCIIMYSPADNSTLRGHLFSRDAKRKSA